MDIQLHVSKQVYIYICAILQSNGCHSSTIAQAITDLSLQHQSSPLYKMRYAYRVSRYRRSLSPSLTCEGR